MSKAKTIPLSTRFESAAERGDDTAAIGIARQLARSSDSRAASVLLKALRGPSGIAVKHAAAIALGDLGADEAVPAIFNLIRSAKYRGFRGTFVYALWPLQWQRTHAAEIVPLICDENFEVREMAVKALERRSEELTPKQRLALTEDLLRRVYRKKLSPDSREAVEHALSLLVQQHIDAAIGSLKRSA